MLDASLLGTLLPVAFPVSIASVLSSNLCLTSWRTGASGLCRHRLYCAGVEAIRAVHLLVGRRRGAAVDRLSAAGEVVAACPPRGGAARSLEADEWEHLARYTLISTPSSILVRTPPGQLLDLEQQPGTVVSEILMRDVLAPFTTREGRAVPDLEKPRRLLAVNQR